MKYDTTTYRKHKRPGAWGSPCPDHIDNAAAQALLDSSVEAGGARYNVEGEVCFRAFPHETDAEGQVCWHGHPLPWSRLPTEAKNLLVEEDRLTQATFRKALRKRWGSEFDT